MLSAVSRNQCQAFWFPHVDVVLLMAVRGGSCFQATVQEPLGGISLKPASQPRR